MVGCATCALSPIGRKSIDKKNMAPDNKLCLQDALPEIERVEFAFIFNEFGCYLF